MRGWNLAAIVGQVRAAGAEVIGGVSRALDSALAFQAAAQDLFCGEEDAGLVHQQLVLGTVVVDAALHGLAPGAGCASWEPVSEASGPTAPEASTAAAERSEAGTSEEEPKACGLAQRSQAPISEAKRRACV